MPFKMRTREEREWEEMYKAWEKEENKCLEEIKNTPNLLGLSEIMDKVCLDNYMFDEKNRYDNSCFQNCRDNGEWYERENYPFKDIRFDNKFKFLKLIKEFNEFKIYKSLYIESEEYLIYDGDLCAIGIDFDENILEYEREMLIVCTLEDDDLIDKKINASKYCFSYEDNDFFKLYFEDDEELKQAIKTRKEMDEIESDKWQKQMEEENKNRILNEEKRKKQKKEEFKKRNNIKKQIIKNMRFYLLDEDFNKKQEMNLDQFVLFLGNEKFFKLNESEIMNIKNSLEPKKIKHCCNSFVYSDSFNSNKEFRILIKKLKKNEPLKEIK
jgi:hypothetical protein